MRFSASLVAAVSLLLSFSFDFSSAALVTVTRVQTTQRCTTQSCAAKLKKVPTTTITTRTTSRTTTTTTKTVPTLTVTDPKNVVTRTTYKPSTTTLTITEVTTRTTFYVATVVATLTNPKYVTTSTFQEGVATSTQYPPTVTIPAPVGFTGVRDDPTNAGLPPPAIGTGIPPAKPDNGMSRVKRDALADPDPYAPKKYPKSVRCTKTLKTIIAVTSTKTVGKTTVTAPPRTSILTYFDPLIYTRVTAKTARTTTLSYTDNSVSYFYRTRTITITKASFSSTVTVSSNATPTYYAACGPNNQAPPVGTEGNPDGGWAVYPGGFGDAGTPIRMRGTIYDCCVMCHNLPASQGVCRGAYWKSDCVWLTFEGVMIGCDENDPEAAGSQCVLYMSNPFTPPGVCRTNSFVNQNWDGEITALANGPNGAGGECPYWKFEPGDPNWK